MLQWCRKTTPLTTEQLAKKIGRPEADILAWESGKGTPSFSQLRRIADACKRPVSIFYLDEPPKDFSLIKDLRRLDRHSSKEYSVALRYEIRKSLDRQEWLSAFLQRQASPPVKLVGSASAADDPSSVGQKLRKSLGVVDADQFAIRDNAASFRFWRGRCESAGLFVSLARGIDVGEMRGFALADRFAPLVVVNAGDADAGKTFTLLHEVVHLMINSSGVSDRNVSSRSTTPDQKAEVFCNAVAAEALVPTESLRTFMRGQATKTIDDLINLAAGRYCVSDDVIARRMLDMGALDRAIYERIHFQALGRRKEKEEKYDKREPKIPGETRAISSVGKQFAAIALNAFYDNEISGSDLASFLGMKLDRLSRLDKLLFKRHPRLVEGDNLLP